MVRPIEFYPKKLGKDKCLTYKLNFGSVILAEIAAFLQHNAAMVVTLSI